MTVPFLDLSQANAPVTAAILTDIAEMIDAGTFTLGAQVAQFESAFASYVGVPHCVGMSSGLDALRIGLRAAGVTAGSEVVVPANTFVATFAAITQTGAVPVPVDVSLTDYNIDVDAASAATSTHTQALLPVHLYGQMADMVRLTNVSDRCGIAMVEDACQAHGATRDGLSAGAVGEAAAFSFYPTKNLGAFGDAGALVTSSAEVERVARILRVHGQPAKHAHEQIGYTARLDTIQAIVLLHKLARLTGATAQRRQLAEEYSARLASVGDIVTPPVPAGSSPSWHLYVVRTLRRDDLADHLERQGIGTGLHYPMPVHLTAAFRGLGYASGAFPVTERISTEVLSLPFFPGLTEAQLELVVEAIAGFFHG